MDTKKIVGGVLALVIVALGGYMLFGKKKTEAPVVATVETVAKVNGVDITKADFDSQLAASITALKAQGVDTTASSTEAALKTQVLNDMINNELVSQGVKTAGVTVTAQEVEAQFQAILTQIGGADKLQAQLTQANLTEVKLRENISKQLAAQKFLLANINQAATAVTDAEAKKFYDDNTKGQKNVPAYKDVKAQIIQQLTLQKQQAQAAAFVQSLRAKAQVETTLK